MSYYIDDQEDSGYLDGGLEITKVMKAEKEASAGSEFDQLHDEVVQEKKTEETVKKTQDMTETQDGGTADSSDTDTPSENTPPQEDAPHEEGAETVSEDETKNPFNEESDKEKPAETESKDAKSEEEDKEPPEQDKTIAESIRNPVEMHYSTVVLEEITASDIKDGAVRVGGAVYNVAAGAIGLLYDLGKVLVALGVQHGPGIADKLRKGVTYLFVRSVKVLFRTMSATSDFIKRHYNSVSSIKKDIVSLKKTSEELKTAGLTLDLENAVYTDEKTLSWFSYGNSASLPGSAQEIQKFIESTVDPMAQRVMADITAVAKMIEMTSRNGVRGNVVSMMDVSPLGSNFIRKDLKNYPNDSPDVETYVYGRALPNGVTFVTNLPKNKLVDIDQISDAYKNSSIFMGVDSTFMAKVESLPFLTLEELDKYIDQISAITDLLQKHTEHYVAINNGSSKLKLSYRHYYQKLASSPEKLSLHESLAEFVFLKQSFASKTYLAGMMDVHDYVTAYLVRATRFAKKNLKALANTKPSEKSPE